MAKKHAAKQITKHIKKLCPQIQKKPRFLERGRVLFFF